MPAAKWILIPVADLTAPKQGGLHMVYKDYWWALDQHGNALFYKSTTSPQCNSNRTIVERFMLGMAVEVRQLPSAYVPVKLSDYA